MTRGASFSWQYSREVSLHRRQSMHCDPQPPRIDRQEWVPEEAK